MKLCIYQLYQNKYYIEKTDNPEYSFQCHVDGNGSHWTRIYLPIMIYNIIDITNYNDDAILEIINDYKILFGKNNIIYNF